MRTGTQTTRRRFHGLLFEYRFGVWFHRVSNRTMLTAVTLGGGRGWDCDIVRETKGGHYYDGTKSVQTVASFRGETAGDAVAQAIRYLHNEMETQS